LADWQVEPGASGGIASLRFQGTELLAKEARPLDAASARWRVAEMPDRVRVVPDTFELSQSMVWPFRHEPGIEVVCRGSNLMPLPPDTPHEVKRTFTVRLAWPASGVAVSIAWDEPRLRAAAVAFRSDPSRIELTIGAGAAHATRPVSWWVELRDGNGAPTIEVVDYDPAWPDQFRRVQAEVERALGDQVVALEHGGSTSVPGLAAKPIIDMWAALRVPVRQQDVDAMAAIGYEHLGEAGLEDRDFFVKRTQPVCHLHCYPAGHREWDRHLAFRDWLRAHPEGAAAYGRLKRELAVRFPADRIAYTEAKSDFIEAALVGKIS